jgi:hypothetical protein
LVKFQQRFVNLSPTKEQVCVQYIEQSNMGVFGHSQHYAFITIFHIGYTQALSGSVRTASIHQLAGRSKQSTMGGNFSHTVRQNRLNELKYPNLWHWTWQKFPTVAAVRWSREWYEVREMSRTCWWCYKVN